jgi:hypothetical protein
MINNLTRTREVNLVSRRRLEIMIAFFRRTLSVSHLCQHDHGCIWIRPVLHLLVKTSHTSRILTHVYDFACRRKTGRSSTAD